MPVGTLKRRCSATGKSYSRRDIDNLQIIVKYCENIDYFVQLYGSDEEDFRENLPLQYSCVFSLEQIGEQIKHLSSELKDGHREINWRGANGLRDKIAHQYGSIDLSWIRSTVLNDIPFLKTACQNILSSANKPA